MKYVLTGSVGHISKPLAEKLISSGHEVSIITSKSENVPVIEELGASALVGNIENVSFLSGAFKGADAVYLMVPPKLDTNNWLGDQKKMADNYAEAIKSSEVKKIVVLSSIGAHMGTGAGPVDGLAYLESKINSIGNIDAVYLRPSYFYYNLFSMIPLIKNAGIMGSNQPAEYKLFLTHPADIAAVAAQKLLHLDFSGKQIQYVVSDERSWEEITTLLTKAIGKENIPWVEFTDEQSLEGMLNAGLPETIAKGYTAMGVALRSGEMQADYQKLHSTFNGKVKLENFIPEFTAAYNN